MDKARAEIRKPESVPIYVYDDQQARAARRDHMHWVWHGVQAFITLFVICLFIWYLYQYDWTSTETITIDGADGVANYVGRDGTIYNGENCGEAHPLANP